MTSSFARTATTYRQGAHTLAGEYYTSDAVLQEEIERLFRRQWMCVGREERVADAGAYLVHERLGESIIVVRGRDGAVRAFHNTCRHRGTKICEAASGQFGATIQCPYHAWTWSTDGHLVGAPHMQDVEGFDKSAYPLLAAPVKLWEGFVFVAYEPDPPPFEEVFRPVMDLFGRFNLRSLVRTGREDYEVRANWKLIMQNYSECLHCPTIHPELNQLLPYTSGANDLHDGPFLGGYMEITPPHESVTMTGRSCGRPLGDLPDADRRRAFYYTLWPNMMVSLHPDYANWYSVWPLSPDRSMVTCEWMMHPGSLDAPGYDPAGAVELWHTVNAQDWHICELSQAGVSSRHYVPGPYSPRESIPAAWDRAYVEAMTP
ncbi:MAG: aromatic ring-hydroxylating dioxygenase subunit alpha [Cytophagaceae bacterium]|nr:aromatic ring-hydroxylating dioxygenase subunit alpha [Gemmatimonadaceae bacterium]